MSDQKVISEMRDVLNNKFVSLEESIENLKPLLGLLYILKYSVYNVNEVFGLDSVDHTT
jgi:hypothetical protein